MCRPELKLSANRDRSGEKRVTVRDIRQARKLMTIVIASKDRADRSFIADLLETEGYAVDQTSDGNQLLSRVRLGGVHLIVSAVTLDGMDGFELLRALAEIPGAPPVAILADDMNDIDRVYLKGAALLGAAATYKRPLVPSVFLSGVRCMLRA